MSDQTLITQIEKLVEEEQGLRDREQTDSQDPDALARDRDRLQLLQVQLDRCWDLLRRRRAFRDAGGDPDEAVARDTDTVERYLQ
jgi:hypothetical protein